MVWIVINVVLAVLLVGAILKLYSLKKEYNSLEEEHFDIVSRHDKVCKDLDLARRENKILQEENARLNQAPKVEKVSKPRKTTAKK